MKIAKLKLPRNLREPNYRIKFDEVDTFWPSQNTIELLEPVFDEEIGNPEGVICYEARPHDDASFGGHFLLLAVKGQSHWMADAERYCQEFNAERGSLTIVNTEVFHWLFSRSQRRSLWAALSWHFPSTNSEDFFKRQLHRERLVSFSNKLVEHFNGTWTPDCMGIYSQWFNK